LSRFRLAIFNTLRASLRQNRNAYGQTQYAKQGFVLQSNNHGGHGGGLAELG
jgi:hypothetical protein